MDPQPPKMVQSSARPMTSRTRKRIEQVEVDEDIARVMAMEEDEKIAAKLQRDYELGVGVDDYHRLGTARKREAGNEMDPGFFEGEDNIQFSNTLPDEPVYTTRDDFGIGKKQIDDSTINLMSSEQLQHGFVSEAKLGNKYDDSDSDEPVSPTRYTYESQRASFQKKSFDQSVSSDSDLELPADTSEKNVRQGEYTPAQAKNEMKQTDTSSSLSSPQFSEKAQLTSSDSVEKELRALLKMIDAYKPEAYELEQKLLPFTPDFIPCIGDIDPMIKIPIPKSIKGNNTGESLEGIKYLGLTMLDEPASMQSDPAVIDLTLRSIAINAKENSSLKVRSVQLPLEGGSEKNHASFKLLQNWVDNVTTIHAKKKSSALSALQPQDVEKLMAEWPEPIDHAFSNDQIPLPGPDLDLTLKQLLQLDCNILDIPVKQPKKGSKKGYIEAAATLFTLYSEFKNSQHFGRK